MLLERLHDRQQLVVRAPCRSAPGPPAGRCCGCRRRRPRPARSAGSRRRRPGCPDAGSRVKATPVPESMPQVAEDHRADVDRGAQVAGDPLLPAVEHRALGVPGVEDRARPPGPAARAGPAGSRARRARATTLLVGRRRAAAQVVGVEVEVVGGALRSLELRRARPRTARRRCRARSCRTSGSAGGRSPRRTARCRPARRGRATDSSLSPMLRTVSIIPGIENFAPERTDTSSGSSASPSCLPIVLLERLEVLASTSAAAQRPAGTSPAARGRHGTPRW